MIAGIKKNSKYVYLIFYKKSKKALNNSVRGFFTEKKKELKRKLFIKMNFCISRTCKSIFYGFKCF